MDNPSWLEINVTVDNETAEAVAEVLSRYAENGVVVERGVEYNDAEDVGTPFGPCRVFGYLPVNDEMEEKRQRIQEGLWHLGQITRIPEPEFKYIQDEDWMASWKKFYRPILIGKKMLILPAWIPNDNPDRIAVKIDPSMAFGTGTHPTTQLCLEMVEKYTIPGKSVIDIGCGSGILAIGALLLGADHALGVDIDDESMQNSSENAERNGILDKLELHKGSVSEIHAGEYSIRQAPVVMANILAPIIIRLFEAGMADLITSGGVILLSGILEEQAEKVRRVAESYGLEFIEQSQIKDWVAIAYRKTNS
ncbi:MAG: 50S ribosomal protein L11 methyltransferase [Flexilinea sp.]